MMKLVALPLVNQIACTRDVLLAQAKDLDADVFTVTIGASGVQDDEVKRQLKPVLQHILRGRIGSLEHDLLDFGIEVR